MSELERELRELGGALDFPAAADLAASVRRDLPPRPRPLWPRRLALAAAVALLALALGLAVPPARSAILRFFGIGSVQVELVEKLPEVRPVSPLALGAEIDPGEAPFTLLESDLLGDPDGIYLREGVVTLLYGSAERVRLLVSQIAGAGSAAVIGKKLLETETSVEFVQIPGGEEPGVWIGGRPHVLLLPGGPPRLAGDTLLWTRDFVTLRLEGARSREQAIELAESMK
jgi:hypothetical protein